MKTIQKGFTLIELLIVIAVLGVLAVAVLSAINPIEQINRSRDAGSRSDAEQMLNAIDRFNTAQNRWPWQPATAGAGTDVLAWTTITALLPTDGTCTLLQNLGKDSTPAVACPGSDEIKASFINRITGASGSTYNDLYISYAGDSGGNSVYVCFNPRSGAMTTEARNRCITPPTDYPSAMACGACPQTSLGQSDDCICLP